MTATSAKQTTVRFKDNTYSADILRAQSGSGPVIEINGAELHEKFDTLVSTTVEASEKLNKNTPIFTKYEGKYVVLLGLEIVLANISNAEGQPVKLKGRLVSSPMLKRCLA
jgi:hypothetical protein